MTHLSFSRRGGKARSPAKTAANRAKAAAYWEAVRSGKRARPRRSGEPPLPDTIGARLAALCRQNDIQTLELFGSSARGEARRGSDVDLIATFSRNPGLRFFSLEEEMARILKTPVHLLTRESVDEMKNPIRRRSILRDARVIYRA